MKDASPSQLLVHLIVSFTASQIHTDIKITLLRAIGVKQVCVPKDSRSTSQNKVTRVCVCNEMT